MFSFLSKRGAFALVAIALAIGGAGVKTAAASPICLPCWNPCAISTLFFSAWAITTLQQDRTPPTRPIPKPICDTPRGRVSLHVDPLISGLAPGNEFDVRITADIDPAISSYGFHLTFDTGLLSLVDISAAPGFKELPSEYTTGVAALAYPNVASGSNVVLATARFTALNPGTATISATLTEGDPTEGFAQVPCGFAAWDVTPGTVTITPPAPRPDPNDPPIPEPTSLALLLCGALLRRRG